MKLTDYFVPLAALVRYFESHPDRSPEELAGQIDVLIQQAQSQALHEGVEIGTFQEALFPVLAWADERISRSQQWGKEHSWQRHLLQRRYFKTSLAGHEFFDRLGRLDAKNSALREVYLLCLCMGFLGRYSVSPNSAELANMRIEQYRQLQRDDKSITAADRARLFPQAYVSATPAKTQQRLPQRNISLRRVLFFLLPPLILLLVVVGLHAELTQSVQQFREAVNL